MMEEDREGERAESTQNKLHLRHTPAIQIVSVISFNLISIQTRDIEPKIKHNIEARLAWRER